MIAIIYVLGAFIADLFKSRRWLEVENLFLRHQLNIILRRPPQRSAAAGGDRALMVWMTRIWPSLLDGHRRAGGHSCATMRMPLWRSICAWFQP
jgi:hypothetical protein